MSRASEYLTKVRTELTLPSGAVFTVRKPNGFWFAAHTSALPLGSADPSYRPTPDEVANLNKMISAMVAEHVVSPKVLPDAELADPEKDQINFADIEPSDMQTLTEFMMGRRDATGSSLEPFSGNGVAANAGATGGTVAVSA